MKYKEFKKIINNSYTKERQAIYENLKQILDVPDDTVPAAESQSVVPAAKPDKKRRTSFKNFFKTPARLAACISAAVAVACLAIILPFTLNRNGSQTATTNPPSTSEDRFCQAAACKEIQLSYSLKEYSDRNNLSLLYVDWYDKAEIKTSLHVNKEDSTDIVYYEEILKHKSRGSIVELYITDMRTNVDVLLDYIKACKNRYIPKNPYAQVHWGSDNVENGEHNMYTAFIAYGKYHYVLVLRYPIYENDILELIDSMLPEFKRQF